MDKYGDMDKTMIVGGVNIRAAKDIKRCCVDCAMKHAVEGRGIDCSCEECKNKMNVGFINE